MDTIDKINLHLTKIGSNGAEMSRALGLSNSIYSQWNTRKSKPSKKTLAKIADYLGVTIDDLIADPPEAQKNTPTPKSEGSDTRRKIEALLDDMSDDQLKRYLEVLQVLQK